MKELARITEELRVSPGSTVDLRELDPGYRAKWLDRGDLEPAVELLAQYQERLAAENTHGLLVVLQGIDAAGKDGAVQHVLSGVNPAGVVVHSFKVPSTEELDHDYLWRYALRLPERGQIAVFNRSHYEEVLVVRVHPELLEREKTPRDARIWKRRYREINDWERYLHDNGFRIVKLFLNLSKDEQRTRFLARIDEPEKSWKFAAGDVAEREHWDAYRKAFSEMLSHTSTEWAPWHVIPADHKKFARAAVAAVIVTALAALDPQYPKPGPDALRALEDARRQLEAEG